MSSTRAAAARSGCLASPVGLALEANHRRNSNDLLCLALGLCNQVPIRHRVEIESTRRGWFEPDTLCMSFNPIHRLTGHQDAVYSVAVSPDGRCLVSGSHDHIVAVWDLKAGTPIHRLTGHQYWVNSVAVSPDGRRIVSGSHDDTVSIWDLQAGQRLATLTLDGDITSLAWHRDGHFVVAGDARGNLYRLEYRER